MLLVSCASLRACISSLTREALTISSAPEERPTVGEGRGAEGPVEGEALFDSPRMGVDDSELADIDEKIDDEGGGKGECGEGLGEKCSFV